MRRAGAPGGEAHYSAVQRTSIAEVRTAIVVRRDGREIGRERVSDLRGALHHYGPATAGFIVTTGQVRLAEGTAVLIRRAGTDGTAPADEHVKPVAQAEEGSRGRSQ